MPTIEDVKKRITLLETANKGSNISSPVWDSLRRFVGNHPELIQSIEQRLNYYYHNDERLMHYVYAIAAVFTKEATAQTVANMAVRAKATKSKEVVSAVISKLISIDTGHRDRACQFTLKSKCGSAKAIANAKMLETSVVEELVSRSKTHKVGVLIIHMYVDPPSLNHIFIGEGSALGKMVELIEAAKKTNVPIFLVWKSENQALVPEKLRQAVQGYHLVKKYTWKHNSFLNKKEYATEIKEKALDDMIVLGYDADVCVKGTVFGSEYANPIPKPEIRQEWDLFRMKHPDRLGEHKLAYDSFLETNRDKFDPNENDYAPSLLELVKDRVVTSRSLLLNDGGAITSLDWGPLTNTRGIPVA